PAAPPPFPYTTLFRSLPGRVTWWPGLVVASVALGILFGMAALLVAARRDTMRATALAAVLLTLAIVSHHFTAMGAVEIVPDPTRDRKSTRLNSSHVKI